MLRKTPVSQPVGASTRSRASAQWRRQAPAALALLPAAIIVVAIYIGAMIWTVRLAFSSSKMLPVFDFVGLAQFQRLFATERFVASGWHILLFGVLFIAGALVLGLHPRRVHRSARPLRGRIPHHLSLPLRHVLHRHRARLAMVPASRTRPAESGARLGLHLVHLRLDRPAEPGHLHPGDRRRSGRPPGS